MEEKREIRYASGAVELRADADKRTVQGYALLFDTRSDRLPFDEYIDAGALDGVIERSDVMALLNHNVERGVLARCKGGEGSLTLEVTERGLLYRFEAPHTALGDELLENLRRGEVCESSFAFDVEKDSWEKLDDGRWMRHIQQIGNLYDVSPVYTAAYSATSVANMRGKEAAEAEIQAREAEERAKAEAKQAEMEAYFKEMNNRFNF